MLFSETINTDTAIGFWSVYGRWIFIAIYSTIILVLLIFLLKKKVKKITGIISMSCCICLLGLMFISGFKTSVFNPSDISAFFYELDNMLTTENISISQTTDDFMVWSWNNENEKMKYIVTVRENTPEYNIKEDIADKQTIYGKIDDYKYAFTPMLPQVFDDYCRLVRYYGKLGMQSQDYYVDVTYSMCGNEFVDYVSVIYPFLYNKNISVVELLEQSKNENIIIY